MVVKKSLKGMLIQQIVTRIRKLGFINVNKKNIATDEVYSQYFSKILNEKLGENPELDIVISQLLTTMSLANKTV